MLLGMTSSSAPDVAVANKQFDDVRNASSSSIEGISSQERKEMRQFDAVLAQLKQENMASLVSSIRQGNETLEDDSPSSPRIAPRYRCAVRTKPLYGSYNLAYHVLFEDGVQWILKVPVSGHHACFNRMAAEALTSEALTMRMIKQTTTIPIPTVHHFDASTENVIGCPYILMDFLEGKPLWQGWFDEKASRSTLEHFRAKSLQTIAAAMVQLSQFTINRSGSLRFNSDDRPVDIAAARVPDWLAEQDIMEGLKTDGEGCLYCEKGPITDAASSILFMLNRRGIREADGSYVRGINEVLRLFTQWTLEKADNPNGSQSQFVLAHPDFALQNFLVKDDGTLCGIIDWDGVAAVPLSVGSLKYPDWLMKDWHPKYDYWSRRTGQQENSPEELTVYRSMYAQFVEAFSSITSESSETGKLNADITRISLVAGILDLGAHDLKLTETTVDIIIKKLEDLTADIDSVASDAGPHGIDRHTLEEEDSRESIAPTETDDRTSDDEQENMVECLCSGRVAELASDHPPASNVDEKPDGERPSLSCATCHNGLNSETEPNLTPFSNGLHPEAVAQDQKASASQKARVAIWALNLGEKGSIRVVKALHKQKAAEPRPSRKVRVVKWALGFGGKCCKGASKAFHKEGASDLGSRDRSQALPVKNDSQPVSKSMEMATGLGKRTKTLLRKVTTQMHPDSVPIGELSEPKQKEACGIRTFVRWLIAMLKNITRKPLKTDIGGLHTTTTTERRLSANDTLVDAEHCQRCNPSESHPTGESSDMGVRSTEKGSEDVWATISAEIDKRGIPIDMIKQRRELITQSIIQYLEQEIQQENDFERHLRYTKTVKGERKAEKPAGVGNKNVTRKPDTMPYSHFLGPELDEPKTKVCQDEMDAAQYGMLKESGAVLKHEKTDTGLRSTDIHVPAVEGLISRESASASSCPEKAVGPVFTRASKDADSNTADPDQVRPHSRRCGSFEPESIFSKLEVAKRRFDVEIALKGKGSESANHKFDMPGAIVAQLGDARSPKSVQHLAALEATEEANRKLRMILSGFEKTKDSSTPSKSNTTSVAEPSIVPAEKIGLGKINASEKPAEATESINQKLRTMLLNLQEPQAGNTNLQKNIYYVAENDDGGCEIEERSQTSSFAPLSDDSPGIIAAQPLETFKGGQWFETSDGSLMRIENGETLHDSLYDHERISSSQGYVSEDKGCLSENLTATKAANDFRVPDIDENADEYGVGRSSNYENHEECDELEDGEIDEEAPSSVQKELNSGGKKPTGEEVDESGVKNEPKIRDTVDSGRFNSVEVCIALGNGNLDEQRMRRLRSGFMALLDDALGRYRQYV